MVNKELLALLKEHLSQPLHLRDLKNRLPEKYQVRLANQLRPLLRSGDIVRIRGGRYGLPEEMNLVVGALQGHPDGYGFVIPEDPAEEDVFVGSRNFREEMHGDKIVCRVESVGRDGKRNGQIIRVLERGTDIITGIFESRGRGGILIPTQKRIIHSFDIPAGATLKAKSGQVVVAKITEYPEEYAAPEAEVVEVLGHPGEPEVEQKLVLRQFGLPEKFPPRVEKLAAKFRQPSGHDFEAREDFRDGWVVTIDGESARDFDDAISVRKTKSGYELAVHIADVSHYVLPGSHIDKEAYVRGNSTYFPGMVVPMLPFHLSNDICSLRPQIERLVLSCVMQFDRNGNMQSHRFTPGIIRSAHRLTYTEVARVLKEPDSEPDRLKRENLKLMEELYRLLKRNRMEEGSVDFDIPEPYIKLDGEGEPVEIKKAERNDAHRLIEDFMLAANRSAALYLSDRPSIYRVHPEPDKLEVEEVFDFAANLGYVTNRKDPSHQRMQKILKGAEGKPEEKLLNYILLRSMKRASYQGENIGHFGLAFEDYTHFTSPIRRYPDLIIHRLIKAKLERHKSGLDIDRINEMGLHCSQT